MAKGKPEKKRPATTLTVHKSKLHKRKVVTKKRVKAASAKKDQNYLTKRILVAAAKKSFSSGASKTTVVMGHNVVVKNGWLVKQYPNGKITRIKRVKPQTGNVAFD
jgi:hypothetical protein